MLDRRHFVSNCMAGGLAMAAVNRTAAAATHLVEQHPIVIFAKPLQSVEFGELGRRLKAMGVNGIEATLRAGGQIEPANLSQQLGPLCEALQQSDQRVVIAASDINDADTESEKYLETLAKHAVPYLRMSYYRFDFSKPILPQLDGFAQQATRLAELCKANGVRALYQNHAGRNYLGAALWDLQQVIANISPEHLAVAIDIRHTTVELSQSFQAGYSVIRPHLGAIYVKDFDWINSAATNVPLGQGRAKTLFDLIRKDGLVGPLSLHMEYIDHVPEDLLPQRWEAIGNDVQVLKEWLV